MQTDEALLQQALSLSKDFYHQSEMIENARRIPPDISLKLAQAGFYRLGIPRAVGGLECSPMVSNQIVEILAQGDASCGWVTFIATTSGTALASIPESAASKIFSDPETLVTGVFAPNGRAEKVDGGFRVSGRWQWGSGSQNAKWVLGGCLLTENGEILKDQHGRPRQHMMIMPADQLQFHDTWQVSGLNGSGSLDYEANELFVPEQHAVDFLDAGKQPATPLYAFPRFTFLALGVGAVCLGIARAAIDELISLATSKRRTDSRKTIAEQSMAQVKVAQAEADLRSARAFYYDTVTTAWTGATSGTGVSLAQRSDIRLATNNAVAASVRVVDEMYSLGGGSAVYKSSRLQRHFRDIHVAKSHIMVSPSILESVGRLLLGVKSDTSML